MILLTGRDTSLAALVDDHEIVDIQSMREKGVSFSRVFLKNDKEHHDYFLDVLENEKEIRRRIKYEKLDLGCEARTYL